MIKRFIKIHKYFFLHFHLLIKVNLRNKKYNFGKTFNYFYINY